MLLISFLLIILIGMAHSILGERYIVKPLLKRADLPQIYGTDEFTKGTIRFAWHLTTIAWFGLGAILLLVNDLAKKETDIILFIVSLSFALSAALSFYFSKAKHFSWFIFILISILSFPH